MSNKLSLFAPYRWETKGRKVTGKSNGKAQHRAKVHAPKPCALPWLMFPKCLCSCWRPLPHNFRQQGHSPVCSRDLHLPTTARGKPACSRSQGSKVPQQSCSLELWPAGFCLQPRARMAVTSLASAWPWAATAAWDGQKPPLSSSLAPVQQATRPPGISGFGKESSTHWACASSRVRSSWPLEFLGSVRHRLGGQLCDLGC